MNQINDALLYLDSVCDGAQALDASGFNAFDSAFGKSLTARIRGGQTLTENQSVAALKMLTKYSAQLEKRGIELPAPESLLTNNLTPRVAPQPKPQTHGKILLGANSLIIKFGYDPKLVDRVRGIEGRRFDGNNKFWTAPIAQFQNCVDRFPDFEIDEKARAAFENLSAKQSANVAASASVDAEIKIEGLGGELRPFQRGGTAYALTNKRVFIADEMGLGKTIEALATMQAAQAFPALVVCPASLKLNWQREARKWIPNRRAVVLNGKTVEDWQSADIIIVNYDILGKFLESLSAIKFRMLVSDECHYVKNYKAQRTEHLKSIAKGIEYRLLMSGTPLLNHPSELLSQLGILGRLDDLGGFWNIANRYCGYVQGRGFEKGGYHLDELNQKMRATCYIRRLKKDVLTELPAKQRSIVPLTISNRREYDKLADSEIPDEPGAHLVRIEELKQLAAAGKMNAVTEWVKNFLDSDGKLVLFAWHRDTAESLAQTFSAELGTRVDCIIGGVDKQVLQNAVDRFQNDDACKLIVLNIQSGGLGLTLTAASNVAFVEFGWNPGTMDQAEDRVHRIGQTESVNAWYLVGEGTIDEDIYDLIATKRSTVDAASDGVLDDDKSKYSMARELIERVKNRSKNE
ncbi:MAG: DEAD/DEAH box helicase [Planctomycetota bacterium]